VASFPRLNGTGSVHVSIRKLAEPGSAGPHHAWIYGYFYSAYRLTASLCRGLMDGQSTDVKKVTRSSVDAEIA